ncbi:UNVERIFIED_CONTAM: hypothetical protein FKN15_001204 [Acipenser sinensis]
MEHPSIKPERLRKGEMSSEVKRLSQHIQELESELETATFMVFPCGQFTCEMAMRVHVWENYSGKSAMSKDNAHLPSTLINIVCELDVISQLDRPKQRNNIQVVDTLSEMTK